MLVGTTSVEKRSCSPCWRNSRFPQPAQRRGRERGPNGIAQAGRAGAVTIATNMAGRGTDIILGGNSDYMARLLQEVLLPRLVRPEDGHSPRASAARCGSRLLGGPQPPARSSESLFPCTLTEDTISCWVSWPVIWWRPGGSGPHDGRAGGAHRHSR